MDPVNKRMGTVFAHDVISKGEQASTRGETVTDDDETVTLLQGFDKVSGLAHSVFSSTYPSWARLTLNFTENEEMDSAVHH